MRLLCWMNHKLRQTSVESIKDFTIGNYCTCLSAQSPIDDHVSCARTNFSSRHGSRLLKKPTEECEDTFSENEGKLSVEKYEDETFTVTPEIFHGFLSIGTLGSEPKLSEPATPTFPMSLENITEGITDVEQYDLKIINDELEKFFEAEAEEEGCNESLQRRNYVSNITFSGMQMEGANAEDYEKTVVCPLQGYLLGSSIELSETRTEPMKEKTSLGGLFCRKKAAVDTLAENKEKGEMQAKQAHKSAKHIIKEILKTIYASPGNPTPSFGDDATYSFSTKKKLNKVLKMFHKKVHPEQSTFEKETARSHKEKMAKTLHNGDYNVKLVHQDRNNTKFLPGSKSMEGDQNYKNNLKLAPHGFCSSNASGSREHWIKTDAEYLVLEL